ncbi:pectate lyase family protein [Fontivita pretiosa]|uniref:pectate lyase family protein n=1 Tax=Fontivita pretiosa TaxID=2989684 RepID=UPI003D173CC9
MAVAASMAAVAMMSAGERAQAQYPTVPPEVAEASNRAKAAANARSDVAWQKALPIIQEWAGKGKPYIPWAQTPGDLPQASIPAFPGAEGGGAYSFGGRGGRVFVVTSLEDSGPGTFREACEAAGPRIVVFNVAGIIRLKDRVRIRAPYITIAGNTAPGDGVCIAGANVAVDTHDVVIRHMRFRRGETNVGDRDDSIGGNPIGNIMIDHVSASWGLDENMSMYRHMYDHDNNSETPALKLPTVNITIQNSIFSECLNTYNHAFGSTIGGYNSTFHHNLWANNTGRNPSVGMNGDFALVNNVIYNWRHRTVDGGDHLSYFNIINNYFKPGPTTPKDAPIAHRILKPEAQRGKNIPLNFGKAYVNGNVVEGNEKVTKDNWAGGVQLNEGVSLDEFLPKIRVDKPFPMAHVTTTTAEQAYEYVLANVGATLPRRDAVDQRIIQEVRTGQATYKEGNGIITDISQVGGYPEYRGEPYKDSDSDGMPDEWESKYGLNPNDASDASGDLNGDGYTNIEKYIFNIDPTRKVDWTDPKNNVDTLARRQTAAK